MIGDELRLVAGCERTVRPSPRPLQGSAYAIGRQTIKTHLGAVPVRTAPERSALSIASTRSHRLCCCRSSYFANVAAVVVADGVE